MKTPDEIVAKRIVAALLEEKLINPDDADSLADKLAQGVVKDSDWQKYIESSLSNRVVDYETDDSSNGLMK